jgi:hypothetical protein
MKSISGSKLPKPLVLIVVEETTTLEPAKMQPMIHQPGATLVEPVKHHSDLDSKTNVPPKRELFYTNASSA